MQTSNQDKPKPVEAKSILLIGPPGGGKTTLAMSFPGVCFLDCDRNLDGPRKYLQDDKIVEGKLVRKALKPDLSFNYCPITYDSAGKAVPTNECYDKLLLELLDVKEQEEVKAVALDGLTLINEFIVEKVMKDQRVEALEMRHWDTVKSKHTRLLYGTLRDLGKLTIVTCHEKNITKADPKNMAEKVVTGYQPFVQSGIRDAFGGLFTDVWRCTSTAAPGGKIEFKIQFAADLQSNYLKNTIGAPSEILIKDGEVAWEKLASYMKGLV